jgi:Ni/Fe-hydrogenase subunit HybB-like protein
MAAEVIAQKDGTGYAGELITKVPAWHGLVAWDLLFNNLTTGLFLAQAIGELTARDVFRPLAAFAYPLALFFLIADLLCLVLDLGDPLRFHHMLRIFKPTSPMSLGTWSLTVYSFPLTVAAGLSLLPIEGTAFEWVRKIAVILGLVPALGSAAYKGVLISTNSQPGWKDARWLGGYLCNSALMLGCAELMALSVFRGQDRAIAVLRPALALLIALNVIFLQLLYLDLRPVVVKIFPARERRWFLLATLGGGILVPILLLLAGRGTVAMLTAVVLVLLGCFGVRSAIIKIPHLCSDLSKSGKFRLGP